MKYLIPLLLLPLLSCGTAKTQYIDTKYDLCMRKCDLTYSRYESKKLYACKAECSKDKYQK